MNPPRIQPLKDAVILAAALYGLAIWGYFLSPWANMESAPIYLVLAALLAFGVAYAIRLFIDSVYPAQQATENKTPIPNGAIQAISSSATTSSAFGIAFLGFWAFGTTSGKAPWEPQHHFVLWLGMLAFTLLAAVPLIASCAQEENKLMSAARWFYGAGSSVLLCSIAIAVYQSL